MGSLQIITWNVLYIPHEYKYNRYGSRVLPYYGDEKERLTLIYQKITTFLNGNTIICLQEVPGDLLTLIQQIKSYQIIFYRHTRKGVGNIYKDMGEYLVTLIPWSYNIIDKFTVQSITDGKAALHIVTDDFIIINTHLTISEEGSADLRVFLYDVMDGYPQYDIYLTGDMNHILTELIPVICEEITKFDRCLSYINITGSSWPQGNRTIDFVFGIGKENLLDDVFLLDCNHLSDHQIVVANSSKY